jgi:murein tripeptide amidase MpaA
VHGIEIAADVQRNDGRPVFLNMGVHHAREWPSVEIPMEFANDLIKNFGKDPRITDLLQRTRVIVVPVVNVDGYNLSRESRWT